MWVLQTAVLSLPLVKMSTFHSFTKRLWENILLPGVGRRQHQPACQLWKRNEPWKQTEGRDRPPRSSTQERTIPLRPQHRNGSWGVLQPPSWQLHRCSVLGLCVARWPGNAKRTYSKHGQCKLAVWYGAYAGFRCSHVPEVRGQMISDGAERDAEPNPYSGTKPNCQILLNSLNWHSDYAGEALCITCSPRFWASKY